MIVYKTINTVNNKWYIGQDSKNNPSYLGSGVLLKNAVKKYGKGNFVKLIIDVCLTKQELNERETFWLVSLDAKNDRNSYNLTNTGGTPPVCKGAANFNYGKRPASVDGFKRSVVCLNTNEFFDSLTTAAKKYNTTTSHISRVCQLKRAQHKGNVFRYIGEEARIFTRKKRASKDGRTAWNKGTPCLQKTKEALGKKVRCLDTGMVFNSLEEARIYMSCSKALLSLACNFNKKAKGLRWSFI